MPERNDVLADRRFWASLYASGFGQITPEPPEPEAYCSLLGVSEKKVIEWNKKFTGWHPGAVLLLLPVVWLTSGDDVATARQSMESAWTASKLVSRESAAGLAALWVKAVEGGRDYKWRRTPGGWLCDAHWSTRSKGRKNLKSLNKLIAAAQ